MIFRRRDRQNFSGPTKREALHRSRGICECYLIPGMVICGRPLSGNGNVYYEHIIPDNFGGGNRLDNCAVLTKTCWKIKTATSDLPKIAKAKRGFDRHWKTKNPTAQPFAGGNGDRLKKKMDGTVVLRATGERP